MQIILKYGDIRNIILITDKELNMWVYRTLSSYAGVINFKNMVHFYPPCYHARKTFWSYYILCKPEHKYFVSIIFVAVLSSLLLVIITIMSLTCYYVKCLFMHINVSGRLVLLFKNNWWWWCSIQSDRRVSHYGWWCKKNGMRSRSFYFLMK